MGLSNGYSCWAVIIWFINMKPFIITGKIDKLCLLKIRLFYGIRVKIIEAIMYYFALMHCANGRYLPTWIITDAINATANSDRKGITIKLLNYVCTHGEMYNLVILSSPLNRIFYGLGILELHFYHLKANIYDLLLTTRQQSKMLILRWMMSVKVV